MQINNFRELYMAELSELCDAERRLSDLLSRARDTVRHDGFRQALQHEMERTQDRANRLRQSLEAHDVNPDMHQDQAMEALVHETEKMMGILDGQDLQDAGLLASIQKIGHYEIAACGTLATYADMLGLEDDKRLLHAMVEEEREADRHLTLLAKSVVNPDALGRHG